MKFPKPNPQLNRIIVISLACLGVVMLIMLAASLQNLELKPAQVFFSDQGNQPDIISEIANLANNVGALSFGEALMLIGGFLILFVLMLAMLSPEARKRLIKTLLRVVLTVWAIYYALTKFRPQGVFGIEAEGAVMEQGPDVTGTPPPYTPPVVPPWLIYFASLLVVLIFAGIGFWLYRILRRPESQLQRLTRATRSALDDLSAGRDWDDTVIQCYARMNEAIDQKRGFHRQQSMTPQEFAIRLEQAGLPSDPVHRLTRLFEKARYGGRKSSQEDVSEAITCLTAILHAVGAQS